MNPSVRLGAHVPGRLIARYSRGDALSPGERCLVEAHCAKCPRCAGALELQRRFAGDVRGLTHAPDAVAGLVDRVRSWVGSLATRPLVAFAVMVLVAAPAVVHLLGSQPQLGAPSPARPTGITFMGGESPSGRQQVRLDPDQVTYLTSDEVVGPLTLSMPGPPRGISALTVRIVSEETGRAWTGTATVAADGTVTTDVPGSVVTSGRYRVEIDASGGASNASAVLEVLR